MAAAVEVREPLVPLFPHNSKDAGRQSTALGKLSQRPKVMRKSATIGASGAIAAAEAETVVENFVSRAAPELIAEHPKPAVENSQPQSRSMEAQGESGITSDGRQDDCAGSLGDEEESKSLMQLKMEAMTWAAMAKDYTISSLESRLRQALEIARAEQERNQKLGRLLRESKEREAAAAVELEDVKRQVEQLIDAEERLCVQLGDLEAEAVEEHRTYRSQIAILTARNEAQDQFIAEALKPFKVGHSPSQQSDSLSYVHRSQYQALSEQLEMAKVEIAALQEDLRDAQTELRVAEGLRKRQARKLKVLEKERWNLTRNGAIRSTRLAPRFHRKSETDAPGGEGWKVFSVLDFQEEKF